MMDRDVLSTIPGELLSAALHSLPDAASSEETTLRLVVELPEGLRAEVTFARLKRPHRERRTQPRRTGFGLRPALCASRNEAQTVQPRCLCAAERLRPSGAMRVQL